MTQPRLQLPTIQPYLNQLLNQLIAREQMSAMLRNKSVDTLKKLENKKL
jgi:hypothetical protein